MKTREPATKTRSLVVRFDDETEEAVASLAFIGNAPADILEKGILAVQTEVVQAATPTT